ncbi:MAG: hypothetical protein OEW80_05345 [Gemmatimonadota bacterium]|nr:hypothetical protein [Gemmatimonadota bacterium]
MLTRPSGSFRPGLAAVTVALFLSMQIVEGTGAHRCAAHDAGAGLQVGAGEPSGHQHAGSMPHGQNGREAGHPTGCPCLGDCQNSPATAASTVHAGPAPAVATTGTSSVETSGSLRSAPHHFLPYANGPPLIA